MPRRIRARTQPTQVNQPESHRENALGGLNAQGTEEGADAILTVLPDSALLTDLRTLIRSARATVARAVNHGLVILYWSMGERIRREVLRDARAEYGRQLVEALATQLSEEYGSGFSRGRLFAMLQFAESFPNRDIVLTLSGQLGWSHFVELLPLKDILAQEFYAELCRLERWSVRTLREKIRGMLYERTAISRQPESVISRDLQALREADRMTADLVFRDPVNLEFLGLADTYSESDLESAMLREIELVLRELGSDFCFVRRQFPLMIDGRQYRIDLLFFHRRLRRLIAVDLKLGAFEPAFKGQMELYLRWLEKYEMRPGEERPMGLILCTDRGAGEHLELLQLERDGIRVAEYFTELPRRDLLEQQLHRAIAMAQERVSRGV